MAARKKSNALWLLIAMWLWCASAAGETLSVTTQTLEQNNYQAILSMPCNWDKNIDKVDVTAVYANPGEYTDVKSFSILDRDSVVSIPIEPLSLGVDGDYLKISFDPDTPRVHDGKFLYHFNVDIGTTSVVCKQGFGFGFGTRPR